MTTAPFNYLQYFDKLKKAGCDEEQAKVQAEALREVSLVQEEALRHDLATKADLKDGLNSLEVRLLRWIIPAAIAQATLLVAVLALAVAWLAK